MYQLSMNLLLALFCKRLHDAEVIIFPVIIVVVNVAHESGIVSGFTGGKDTYNLVLNLEKPNYSNGLHNQN